MTEHDEILIQKCVDNELVSEERRALMQRLDEIPDGWKSLSCCFMEDQLFAKAAQDESRPPVTAKPAELTMPARHWFNRPVTSLVLSVCIAFLLGVLVRGEVHPNAASEVVAEKSMVSRANDASDAAVVAESSPAPTGENNIRVRLVGDGMPSEVLPFYPAKDYVSGSEAEWQRISKLMDSRSDRGERRTQTIWLFINGETFVIPVVHEEEPTAPLQ